VSATIETTTEKCWACKKDIPEWVNPRDEDDGFYFHEYPMCPECEESQRKHYEEIEREEELVRQHGGLHRCPKCDNFSVKKQDVCTLGYPGHPGAEFSVYSKCQREECDYAEL